MAAFYVFAIGFWLLRDVAGSGRLVLWCVGSFVATLGAGIYWRQNPLTEGAAHRAAYLVTLWGAVGTALHLATVPDPYVSAAFAMVALGTCVFFAEPKWIFLACATQATFFGISLYASGRPVDAAAVWITLTFAFFGTGFYLARNRVAWHFYTLASRRRMAIEGALRAQKFESLGVLAGGVAHDFNNLLSVILAHAERIGLQTEADPKILESAKAISGASEQAAALCEQLLTYVGGRALMVRPADLNALIRETYPLLEAATSRRSELRFNLSERIGPVFADVNRIRQLLLNLISNAREAVGPNDGEIVVSTRVAPPGTEVEPVGSAAVSLETPHVCLTIRDNGVGMSRAVLERMFDPFFSTKGDGRGLGLSSVQGIVSSASGLLEVESFPDAGSEFRIYLPEHDQEPVAASRDRVVDPHFRGETRRILLVDDREDVLEATGILATQLGYEVATATSGERAIELVKSAEQPFECALIDAMMPGLDGGPTAVLMRAAVPSMRIVLFSGVGEADIRSRNDPRSYDAYLRKPFTLSELADALAPPSDETRYLLN